MSEQLITLVFTYNEIENIERLVREYFSVLPDEILLIVDDNSPDGTGELVLKLQTHFPLLYLLSRHRNRGRGSAAREGYKYALERWHSPYFVHMDGDLSHHPETIPRMIKFLEQNHVVIASRFFKKGKDLRRDLVRRFISFMSNIWIRLLFSTGIRDNTSGFVAQRREVVAAVLSQLTSTGPEIVEEMLYYFIKMGFRIKEIPYSFHERSEGETKLNFWKLLQCFMATLKLRVFGKL